MKGIFTAFTAATALFVLVGCATPGAGGSGAAALENASLESRQRDDVPAGLMDIRTTSPEIYLNNLDGRIQVLTRNLSRRDAAPLALTLASDLSHRARITGRSGDFEKALERVNGVLRDQPDNARALLARAGLRSALHRFPAALEDIEKAEAAGAEAKAVATARADVLVALGQVAEAEAGAKPHLADDLTGLAFRANRKIDRGEPAAADALFVRAQEAYRDSNPYPLAWLHVQHGVLFLRHGDHERAAEFFRAAHERLPSFYLATEHLAETLGLLGRHEESARLYRQVSEQTDDPVFHAALADAERALGNEKAAAEAESLAREGFEQWLDRRPQAAWQHASEFYLDRGEKKRAVDLARRNADLRQNVGSLLLLARAEAAAGNDEQACDAWNRAHESGLNPPEFADLAGQFGDC